ncbi:MAG: hypothetical protein R2694_17950 [Ilumatobacteraceae bacterium]
MADRPGKRPFWMHQAVEYLLGLALVASAMRNPTPVVPSIAGGVIVLWAALTSGALGARTSRCDKVGDPVLDGLLLVAAFQPWWSVESSARMLTAAIAVVHLFVWFQSRYDERKKKPAGSKSASSGDRATDLGRAAGRLVGNGVNAVRRTRESKAEDAAPVASPHGVRHRPPISTSSSPPGRSSSAASSRRARCWRR